MITENNYLTLLTLFELSADAKTVSGVLPFNEKTVEKYRSIFARAKDKTPLPASFWSSHPAFMKALEDKGYKPTKEVIKPPAPPTSDSNATRHTAPMTEAEKAKAEADALNVARLMKALGEICGVLEDILEEEKHHSEQLDQILKAENANADNLFDKVRGISETVSGIKKRC